MKFLAFLGQKAILIWGLLLFTLLGVSSILVRSNMPMDGSELSNIHLNGWAFFASLVIFVCLIFLLLRLLKYINETTLFIFGLIFYILVGVYLIFHQNDVIRHDALAVLEAAKALNNGDIQSLTDISGYLHKYPHQLGLVSFERLILTVFGESNIKVFFIINLILSIIDNFFLWKITKRVFKKESISKLVIILSFAFLSHLFNILFVYGLTFGLFFAIVGLFFLQIYFEKKSWSMMMLSIIFLTLSDFIRNNYIILIVTIFIVLVFDLLQHKSWKNLAFIALLALSIYGSNNLVSYHYKSLANKTNLDGEPKIAWVAMGLNDTPLYNRVAGWYDAYVENVYNEYSGNSEKIEEVSKKQIATRTEYMVEHPQYTFNFFKNKFLSTWTDSLFESIWSGPVIKMPVEGQKIRGQLMSSIYEGKTLYKVVYYFSALLLAVIYVAVLLAIFIQLFDKPKDGLFTLIPIIYLSGGFIFHLIWETKSQYVYPYVYLIIPLAAVGISYVAERLKIFN